ncbi:FAD-dependent oxidoreductase [Amycolatopsis alkalitolerans]|uniref:FAD-dependent oxidoreductase n=1 Tax=Amycolatopsis alkalitolerans TaxID=2547244 RepID=A0A5C4M3C4_9PSEU|nr:FAD-dependent oxidoreductase [Amycolatopsis alkalitolerans]TNC26934.1 FAD-dependent oxidoreductase [Amycolatopsis alkalitolerans]
MASIIVCGGGPIGLLTSVILARSGHVVTVLESDPQPAPETPVTAWESWQRKGVAQFRQPHNLFSRFRIIADEEIPGLTGRLVEAGCARVDALAGMPPMIADRSARPGDEKFRFVTGRRPVLEAVFAAVAEEEPHVTVRRGVRVAAFLPGPEAREGIPHVAGVRTAAGEELRGDLVVDAMGRRSPSRDLLAALGARPPVVDASDVGFMYYSRYFTGPERPKALAGPLGPFGTFSLLTLMGDNDTWSVTLWASSHDKAMKALRHEECFRRVVQACPLYAHWLDGTPVTGIMPLGGILDRYHRFTVDGLPVATGYAALGDAWACTNPTAGRGLSVGLLHGQLLRDTVRDHLDDPFEFAQAWDATTERLVAPFYWNQIRADRARISAMEAVRDGRAPAQEPSIVDKLFMAAAYDPDVFRAALETVLCLALPQEVVRRPAIAERIANQAQPPRPLPGPDRGHLLDLLVT